MSTLNHNPREIENGVIIPQRLGIVVFPIREWASHPKQSFG
jgi:hypothetical protein